MPKHKAVRQLSFSEALAGAHKSKEPHKTAEAMSTMTLDSLMAERKGIKTSVTITLGF